MDYEKQGIEFLTSCGITMDSQFLGSKKHFPSDTEVRDVFRVKFNRKGKRLWIRFGQSIHNSNGHGDVAPSAYDVLASLTKSDPGSLIDFTRDYGYKKDDRYTNRIYLQVCLEWQKVQEFFSAKEIEELCNIS